MPQRAAAVYARYSTDEQRATSIEDQVRRAREKAEALGYEIADEHVFTDAAQSGQAKSTSKRIGYAKLLKAWERGDFEAVVVDEVSRLARATVELAKLQELIEIGKVRFLTTDGLDSLQPGWQLQFGFQGVIASHFIRETKHRVIRGMIGQLERGYMIAAAPYGYKSVREGAENSGGTRWEICEMQAAWVRKIFEMRSNGHALAAIARMLNQENISCPRKARNGGAAYWRPATVNQMLKNPIYRGLFIWNGSPFTKAKSKREGKKVEEIEYARPLLRLVSDQLWQDCNRSRFSRSGRASGKHVFAGLFGCGECGATLSVMTGGSAPSLTCAQCAQAKRVGVAGRHGYCVSIAGVKEMLLFLLRKVLTSEHMAEFRSRLQARLEGNNEVDLRETRATVSRLIKAAERLLGLMSDMPEDEQLAKQYRTVISERREAELKLKSIEDGIAIIDRDAIKAQLEVDPAQLLPRLFSDDVLPEHARSVLMQIFPEIKLIGKTGRFTSRFSIHVAVGAIPAIATKTSVVDSETEKIEIELNTSAKRPTTWAVREV